LTIPAGVGFAEGGLASCALVTALHAFRKASPRLGDSVAVIGVGGIGLVLLQLAKAAGVCVAAIDRSTASLESAQLAGADLALKGDDPDLIERLHSLFPAGRSGFDVVFELVGRTSTMKVACELAARGGTIVVVGEEPEPITLDTITLAQRELRIVGSRNGSRQEIRDVLELVARGVVRPAIAARFPLERINDAFAASRQGNHAGRVVVTVRDDD
jgi:propanol-preferring alcohol dehydrogenase